ncbi:MAG: hypothetical protein CFK52_06705 [Chloracidobacterium sp. CP2_5A]|nr:MAG: hypothetical protein CFK52_06705 [Chloracidobacterium sp. CP2_5A]
MQAPFVMEIVQKGAGKGLIRGREPGRRLEAPRLILRQRRYRLSALGPNTETGRAALSLDDLESLGGAPLGFQPPDDLHAWRASPQCAARAA